jgi:hypothetical protein
MALEVLVCTTDYDKHKIKNVLHVDTTDANYLRIDVANEEAAFFNHKNVLMFEVTNAEEINE